ncbi:MAG: hypothetical protein KAZ88_14085 [Acidimicrobiia bacterium]|jgi:hypothetical protein|nr:hypothetical protein [Acidimicrobiia bacterium]MBP8182100.1 hypothetical protein [Acidimicrobiia bacterium]
MLAAESDSGGGILFLLALGPAGGAGMYWLLYRYYRNTDKSHSFEKETRVEAKPITGTDRKVDEIKGTRKSGISGDNSSSHRKRVSRLQ